MEALLHRFLNSTLESSTSDCLGIGYSGTHLIRDWVGLTAGVEVAYINERHLLLLPGITSKYVSRLARNLAAITTKPSMVANKSVVEFDGF
jgi:hypothetical protein